MTISRKIILFGITALLCIAVIFFNYTRKPGKIFIYAAPVKTVYGWGYNVLRNHTGVENPATDSIYIKQEYMPAVAHKPGFHSASDAKKVGDLVVKKIMSNQLPAISSTRFASAV